MSAQRIEIQKTFCMDVALADQRRLIYQSGKIVEAIFGQESKAKFR